MDPPRLLFLALLVGCRHSPTRPADSAHAQPAPPAMSASAPTASAAPPMIDLGPNLVATPFVPGRFATEIQRALRGTHARQWLIEDSTATFALELGTDGSARACRSWRYDFSNDGPEVHTAERFNEQQGYRGSYTVQAGIVEASLLVEDGVCAAKREFSLPLARSPAIKLRCAYAMPHGPALPGEPVLACQRLDSTTRELDAQLVAGLAPEGWLLLGAGNGLRVTVKGMPGGARVGRPTEVVATPASEPLGNWSEKSAVPAKIP